MRGTSKENRSGFGPADFISADGTVREYVSEWCDDNSVICDVYSNITDELEESAAKIPLEKLKNVDWYMKKKKRGLTMAENKMEQIAAMFGKKLGEKFTLYSQYSWSTHITAMFTRDGVFTKDGKRMIWVLESLLIGKVEIVEDEK